MGARRRRRRRARTRARKAHQRARRRRRRRARTRASNNSSSLPSLHSSLLSFSLSLSLVYCLPPSFSASFGPLSPIFFLGGGQLLWLGVFSFVAGLFCCRCSPIVLLYRLSMVSVSVSVAFFPFPFLFLSFFNFSGLHLDCLFFTFCVASAPVPVVVRSAVLQNDGSLCFC